MLPSDLLAAARQLVEAYTAQGKKIVTAESCTGGLIGAAITSIAGASAVLERGFITYSNESKTELLGVDPEILSHFGAVSAQTAEAMAQGALEYSLADAALSVTGIAGPGGGTALKPTGTVFFGLATREGALFHMQELFEGDRDAVRHRAALRGMELLLSLRKDPA